MDNSVLSSKESIAQELKMAVKNINRNLFTWKQKKGEKINFTIGYNEVYSLTRNWVMRALRNSTGQRRLDMILRSGNIHISIDQENLCIKGIYLPPAPQYKMYRKEYDDIADIFAAMDFTALRYDPSDYELDGVRPKQDHIRFNPVVDVDLSSLSRIKF